MTFVACFAFPPKLAGGEGSRPLTFRHLISELSRNHAKVPVFIAREGLRTKNSPRLQSKVIKLWAQQMLDKLSLPGSELSIVLCDDRYIQELNLEHRGKDKPTDVLSFPQAEFLAPEQPKPGHGVSLLGDVVISLVTASRQAESRKRPFEHEVRFLLAHGLLHLLGHDHMIPDDKRIMKNRTRQLVRAASRDD